MLSISEETVWQMRAARAIVAIFLLTESHLSAASLHIFESPEDLLNETITITLRTCISLILLFHNSSCDSRTILACTRFISTLSSGLGGAGNFARLKWP